MSQLLAAGQPLLDGFKSASQKRKRGRIIQALAPAAESGRIRNAIRIFQKRRGAFPRAMLDKTSPERLTTCHQAVMGVGQGESGKESESMFAEIAEPAAVLDPVVTVVMRLLAPQAMANDRVAQTQGTPAKDTFPASRPVKARLAMVRRTWDNGDRTAWKAPLLGGILRGSAAQNRAFLLPARYQLKKDNSLPLATRIGR